MENSSSCSDSPISEVEYSSDSSETSVTGCYMNEPEYSKAELEKVTYKSSDSEEEDELNSSRLENLHWCTCTCCVIYNCFTLVECKCCQEFFNLLNDKLNDNKCITMHKDFEILCLNRTVLETASIRHRRYQKKYNELSTYTNKEMRYTSYRQYTAWVHYYERLGKGCRVVIPACVVRKIREEFPDSDRKYTGFKEFVDI
ncbi:P2X purinoceptor 7-like [Hydractinia symbiolongicarpus]|uniref:P2X purinoceptor 7-like n=1 Tax=Hydractinia symbiolongicarpus TaxID=13093 RepID=UPI002550A433|nr:P2X purinoceptor 7-like [Hydractinia symbiolongicarpus]